MSEQFSIVKKGYDPAQVDWHLSTLNKELEEYRSKDAAISAAFLSAQIAADEIRQRAERAAEMIMQNARGLSSRLNEKSADQVATIILSVRAHREQLKDFKNDYNALVGKYLTKIEDSDIAAAEMKAIELEGYLQKFLDTEFVPESRAMTESAVEALTPDEGEIAAADDALWFPEDDEFAEDIVD